MPLSSSTVATLTALGPLNNEPESDGIKRIADRCVHVYHTVDSCVHVYHTVYMYNTLACEHVYHTVDSCVLAITPLRVIWRVRARGRSAYIPAISRRGGVMSDL